MSQPGGMSTEADGTLYQRIRSDIISGRLPANERLKVAKLATLYSTSTIPVREALQQLRGEGFVTFSPNRGARVREIDESFVRNSYEIAKLIEPYMTQWFVGVATAEDVRRLEEIQEEIEKYEAHSEDASYRELSSHLDTQFHLVFYETHYNSHALELWRKHLDILSALTRNATVSLERRAARLREHRALIECVKNQDAEGAASVVAAHVEGAARQQLNHVAMLRSRSGRT